MKCPNCDSDRVYRSRALTLGDRALKRLLPVTFYRCHACDWRRPKFRKMSGREIVRHVLSVIGYVGSVGLAIAILIGILFFTLTLLGVSVPWTW